MKINYYNDATREYGSVTVKKTNGLFKGNENFYVYRCNNAQGEKVAGIVGTMDEANLRMKGHGYERIGIEDENGAMRYTLALPELQDLYKRFEIFVADCTRKEYAENLDAIATVYALIKKHIEAEALK